MLKLSDNPPILPNGLNPFQATEGRWWVAHTRSRCEKALAWDLIDRQVSYFLPMVERISISGGKKRRARIPLFQSHVFLKGNSEVRTHALQTGRACRVIDVLDQATLNEELNAINRALESGIRMDSYDTIGVGDACKIVRGPLAGIKCTAIRWGRLTCVVLPLTILRCGVLMQLETTLLEKLPASAGPAELPVNRAALPAFAAENVAQADAVVSRLALDRLRIGKNYATST